MDLCGRCLVILNATTSVRVRYGDTVEWCQAPTNPIALAAWVERHGQLSGGDAVFEINDTRHRFLPFSTWHGDPVCSVDLWFLVDKERRAR